MSGTIYQAAAGAILQQMRLEVLSNNLANVNTTGFKSEKPIFRMNDPEIQEASQTPLQPGRLNPYAPPLDTITDFSSGSLNKTGNPLDVAIVGKGFFEVETPEGRRFTRNGSFTINDQGALSTAEGWPIMGQSGEINIDGGRVEISDQGMVSVDGEVVDALQVVDFEQPQNLRKSGSNFFFPINDEQPTMMDENIRIAQGFVEASNVDTIRSMTDMIETMRIFEAYQKIIRTADDTTAKTVNEVGRIT